MSGALDHLEVETGRRRTCVDGTQEVRLADAARARRLQQQPTLRDQRDRQRGQALVGADRARDLRSVLGERRRVDDHDVEAPSSGSEPLELGERIAPDGLERACIDGRQMPVEVHVAPRRGDGERARVDRQDRVGSAGGSVHGEAAGAAEQVEHAGPVRERADEAPVVALIEEVARLLTPDDVGFEGESRLEERHRPGDGFAGHDLALLQPVQLLLAGGAREAQHDRRRREHVDERVHHVAQVRHPRRGVQLDHEHVGVAVDHQPGEAVVLAVYDAVPVRRGSLVGGQRRTPCRRLAQAGAEPRGVDRRRRAFVEHLHADRRGRIPQADGDETPVVVEHDREVAGCTLARRLADRPLVEPRMPGAKAAPGVGRGAHRDALG